jgi:hypothetical protein
VTAKQIAVRMYVVRLSEEERGRLNTLIHAGKHVARLLTKARILLKADAAEAGEHLYGGRGLNGSNRQYNICLLQHLGGVQSRQAAMQIASACRTVYPLF